MDCIFLNRCYQQWLRIKNCLSKHKYFVNIKSDLFSIFLVKQHNTQKWPKNSYIFLILEPIGRFVHCKKCSPPNMANKMSLNSYLDHHLCLIFQIWLHNNASWQKGHLIVHLAKTIRSPKYRFIASASQTPMQNINHSNAIWAVTLINILFGEMFLSLTTMKTSTFMYGLNQWETTLQCNVVSHWLSTYPEWSLIKDPVCRGNPWHATSPYIWTVMRKEFSGVSPVFLTLTA